MGKRAEPGLEKSDSKISTLPKTPHRQTIFSWLTLFHRMDPAQRENAATRLKLPSGSVHLLEAAANLESRLPILSTLPIADAVKVLDGMPEDVLIAVMAFNPDSSGTGIIQKYRSDWQKIKPTITGRHLEKLGIPRGPNYRTILDSLRSAWLSGEINNPDEEEKYVNELSKRYK